MNLPPKDILLLTAGIGSGHNQAARALEAQLRLDAPDLDIEIRDSLEFTSRAFRLKYLTAYLAIISKLPALYGLGFALTNRPNTPKRTLSEQHKLLSERFALRKLGRWLAQRPPRMILHTHFLAPPYIDRLRNTRNLPSKQHLIITDTNIHRWWYSTTAECYYLATEHAAERVARWGIDPEKICVSGIPIHPKWTAALPNRDALLAEWNLPADKSILLLSGGTDCTLGPIVKIARALVARNPEWVVVVLAGRNKKLLTTLSTLKESAEQRIVPLGFSDRLPELASLATLMITKPGGLTTSECVAKGLPMIFIKPVPGQEGHNAKHLAAEGAGIISSSTRNLVQTTADLLADPTRLAAMKTAAQSLYRPGCQTIVRHVLDSLSQSPKV